MIPEVLTERLRLRALREQDLDPYAALMADREAARFLGGVQSREDTWRQIAVILGHWTLRGFGLWAVDERETGRFVGRVGLWFPEGWPELEVGWALARPSWGRGYATEAATASIAWGRSSLGLRRIASVIDPGNERSIAVAARLGMAFDRPVRVRGTDAALYARAL